MARLDLHLHSTCSDGTKPPEWVVQQASSNGAELIALTDHDTLAGVHDAQRAGKRYGIEVLAGVEISVNDSDVGELHVLGYFAPGAELDELEQQLSAYRDERQSRARRTVDKLNRLGAALDFESVARIADGASVGRPHIARALVEAGQVESVQEAFDRFLHNEGPAFVLRTCAQPVRFIGHDPQDWRFFLISASDPLQRSGRSHQRVRRGRRQGP